MSVPHRATNRLAREKSPYLLQHAANPVDWYPWGEEAFETARKLDRPIFLSIGYSTCHWCHVMEHESFEDAAVAEFLNAHYVSIKVDREERPDVDRVYMGAVQAMTGSGGWPLSLFLTPDLKPFYGGTYFPRGSAHGRPGFLVVLQRIAELWSSERQQLIDSGEQLISLLRSETRQQRGEGGIADSAPLKAFQQFAGQFDSRYAGFGSGPKFPRPSVLNFLLRFYYKTADPDALRMTLETLTAMARGGIYDHIGGGFHRYSVDGQWRVPHFEKMLYDQAQLVCAYLEAYQIAHDESYAVVARECLEYVLRDMTDPGGGFYSAEDADSPDPADPSTSSEGAFYLWTRKEIDEALEPRQAGIFCHHFGVDESGNALSDPQGEFRGKNILFVPFTVPQSAEHLSLSEEEVATAIKEGRAKLFERRSHRPRPLRDDKIITAWNGLMISAFARASNILGEAKYADAARKAAAFVRSNLYDPSKRILKRRYRDGEARFPGQLDDYAFYIQGLIDLYEATFEIGWLKFAMELQREQESAFWDAADGGFFDHAGKDPSVFLRTKEAYDGAEPSGNSVAVSNLIRLAAMGGDGRWRDMAGETLRAFTRTIGRSPEAMPQLIASLEYFREVPKEIVIADGGVNGSAAEFLREIASHFMPFTVRMCADSGEGQTFLSERLPFIGAMSQMEGRATAYVCERQMCNLPINDLGRLRILLGEKSR